MAVGGDDVDAHGSNGGGHDGGDEDEHGKPPRPSVMASDQPIKKARQDIE